MRPYRSNGLLFAQRLALALCWTWLFAGAAVAAEPAAVVAAQFGEVSVQRSGAAGFQTVSVNAELFAGDTLRTGADGRATLLLSDESLVQVNRDTRLMLKSVDQSAGWLPAAARSAIGSIYELLRGELWFRNKNPDVDLSIETPHVAIGVRGTEFVVRVVPGTITEIDMLEGRILASNPLGSIEAGSGEQVYAVPGAPPRKRLLLNPQDAVQWTVLVPPLLSAEAAAVNDPTGDRYRTATKIVAALDRSDPGEAREALESALADQPTDPFLRTALAWLDLNDGRTRQAAESLADVTREYPEEVFAWQAYALALLAVNDTDGALTAIEQAQRLETGSAQNYLVASYIEQARFSLDEALVNIEQALAIDPENTIALVNASRIHFGRGEFRQAEKYATQAAALDGDDPEIRNLLGYLELAQGNTEAAAALFEQAIARDPSFAEAHLGMGLAKMRQNDATAALEAITTAVALEPTRSLYMSYWGRILYELERHQKALEVLDRAAELDPRDPTPWYLRAVVLRDLNRLGESIDSYNRAVNLNENRSVYRSRFLLDQDLAVRNVDLSLIFQEYRFNVWAERKAVSAINDDFGNFGAHIMYAGALSEQENRNVAFISETLQTRILQPANVNSFNSFNQYTTFLEQPSLQGTIKAELGSYNIRNLEADVFGALPDQGLALQVAYSSFESDGWNQGLNGDDIEDFSAILKWDATIRDSFLLVYENFESTLFDRLGRRFEYGNQPDPTARTDGDLTRYEFGYHHNFRPGMNLLAYLAYVELQSDSRSVTVLDASDPSFTNILSLPQHQINDRDSWQAQLAFNARFDNHEIIVGTSHYWGDNDVKLDENAFLTFGPPGNETTNGNLIPVNIENSTERSFHSVYAQDTWTVNDWLDLEAAVYFDYLENSEPLVDDEWDVDEVNPRFGIIITPNELDTFRLAAFRYLQPFFSGQLSPTEVAGLTVYRNTQEAALIKNAEIAWERNWGSGFLAVNGFTLRSEVEARLIPPIDSLLGEDRFDPPVPAIAESKQKGVEIEVNQQIGWRFGVLGRYLYADVEDDFRPDNDRNENRADLGLTFIDPTGFSVELRQIFRYLDLDNRSSNERIRSTDLDVGYLFPNRAVELRFLGRNIFDNHFNWVTDQFTLGGVIPERNILFSMEINF